MNAGIGFVFGLIVAALALGTPFRVVLSAVAKWSASFFGVGG
jgi:hypothetical protein